MQIIWGWPVVVFMFTVFLDFFAFIIMGTLPKLDNSFPLLSMTRRLAPLALEFLTYFASMEWGVLKGLLLPYFVQAKVAYALMGFL